MSKGRESKKWHSSLAGQKREYIKGILIVFGPGEKKVFRGGRVYGKEECGGRDSEGESSPPLRKNPRRFLSEGASANLAESGSYL